MCRFSLRDGQVPPSQFSAPPRKMLESESGDTIPCNYSTLTIGTTGDAFDVDMELFYDSYFRTDGGDDVVGSEFMRVHFCR